MRHVLNFYREVSTKCVNDTQLEDLLIEFRLKELLDSEADSLSGGQKQRFNVLLALLSMPQVVIFDEISTGLDIGVRYRLLEYVKSLKEKNNLTIIVISHSVDEIELLTDRLILLEAGKIIKDDLNKNIEKEYGSISTFLFGYFKDRGNT